jgi:hypothetical protein
MLTATSHLTSAGQHLNEDSAFIKACPLICHISLLADATVRVTVEGWENLELSDLLGRILS